MLEARTPPLLLQLFMFVFPAYVATPAGLQVEMQMEEKLVRSDQTTRSIYFPLADFSAVLTSENKALMWNVMVFDIPRLLTCHVCF